MKDIHGCSPTEREDHVDLYLILDVDPSATPAEIKRAFHEKIKSIHPDLNQDIEDHAHVQQLNEAYRTLMDVDERKMYDFQRAKVLEGQATAQYLKQLNALAEKRETVNQRRRIQGKIFISLLLILIGIIMWKNSNTQQHRNLAKELRITEPLLRDQVQRFRQGELELSQVTPLLEQVESSTEQFTVERCLERFPNELEYRKGKSK